MSTTKKWIRVGTSMVCGDACIDKRQCAEGVCFALRFHGKESGTYESFGQAEQELEKIRVMESDAKEPA